MNHKKNSNGFSLLELSVVLIVMGLLVGGIITGRDLIRQAQIRSVTKDLLNYKSAIIRFKEQYRYFPGDMPNATRYWGSAGGTGNDTACDNNITTASPRICNGNGNGRIDSTITPPTSEARERFYAWKSLSNAGLVAGAYSGRSVDPVNWPQNVTGGVNAPLVKLSGMPQISFNMAFFLDVDPADGNPELFLRSYQFNTIFLVSGLSPAEAFSIDNKLDDGLPGLGNLFTTKSTGTWSPGCATTNITASSVYNTTNNNRICGIYSKL